MESAALHHRMFAEDPFDARGERFGPVDHAQDPGLEAQSSGDQVGEEILHDHGVLGVAVPDPHGDLRPVGGDRQCHHAAALGENDPVDHQRRHVQLRQVASDQLGQLRLSGRLEPARHRRLGVAPRRALQTGADRLGHQAVAAGGHAGQHPLHRHLGQQVRRGEHRVAVQADLTAAVSAHRPGPAHRHLPAAQHHRARSAAVALGCAVRVVLASRAGHRGDLLFHHLGDHDHAGGAAERHQAFSDRVLQVARQLRVAADEPQEGVRVE